MKERVEILGGRLEIDSEFGRGTRIRISLPLQDGAAYRRPIQRRDRRHRLSASCSRTITNCSAPASAHWCRRVDDIEIVGEAEDGRDAVRMVAVHQPDVVLMDIAMPKLNGLDAAARISRDFPRVRVIMLSMNADEDSVLKSLRAGAVGYLVKTADPAELALAVRAAKRGDKFLSSAISAHVVDACLGPNRQGTDITRTADCSGSAKCCS